MSIFGVDWNMDGNIDEFDLATDLFIVDEIEKEERKSSDSDFDDDFDNDFNK